MAKLKPDDIYIIERDERDIGGKLERIATYYDWEHARDAWKNTPPDDREDVQLWFVKLEHGIDDPAHHTVLECKQKGDKL